MSELEALIAQRIALANEMCDCEPGAFPGSPEHEREAAAIKKLKAFDAAHPEVLPAIRAQIRSENGW